MERNQKPFLRLGNNIKHKARAKRSIEDESSFIDDSRTSLNERMERSMSSRQQKLGPIFYQEPPSIYHFSNDTGRLGINMCFKYNTFNILVLNISIQSWHNRTCSFQVVRLTVLHMVYLYLKSIGMRWEIGSGKLILLGSHCHIEGIRHFYHMYPSL